MLAESSLPKSFWAEAISTACYISNRSPRRCLGGRTPEELWTGVPPDLSHLKVFGCRARAHVPSHLSQKIEPTSKPAVMIGYSETQKSYRLWSEQDKKVFTSCNVEFFEDDNAETHKQMIFVPFDDQEAVENEEEETNQEQEVRRTPTIVESELPDNVEPENREDEYLPMEIEEDILPAKVAKKRASPVDHEDEPEIKKLKKTAKTTRDPKQQIKQLNQEVNRPLTRSVAKRSQSKEPDSSDDDVNNVPARRPQRRRAKPKSLDDFVTYSTITEPGEPRTYEEAISGPESVNWMNAMQQEINSINKNNTWTLCNIPSGHPVIGCKWVYKTKVMPDKSVIHKSKELTMTRLILQ